MPHNFNVKCHVMAGQVRSVNLLRSCEEKKQSGLVPTFTINKAIEHSCQKNKPMFNVAATSNSVTVLLRLLNIIDQGAFEHDNDFHRYKPLRLPKFPRTLKKYLRILHF